MGGLIHLKKRDTMPLWKSLLIRGAALVAAFLFCSVVLYALEKRTPIELLETMFTGSLGTERRIWKLIKDISILLCISLAVTPAFRMKFWNIGAEGQVLVGGLATAACLYYLGGKMPDWLLIAVMIIAAVAAGALWGVIPAIFKSIWNTNETLFTLMMNYLGQYLVAYFLLLWTPDGSSTLPRMEEHGMLPTIGSGYAGEQYLLIILLVALLTVIMYFYLNYSKQGYEISVVGESQNTARYVGINVPKVIIRTMIVSGALCGLAGFLIVGGLDRSVNPTTAGGQGFTAIMVSWLAKFNPLIMVATSFFIIFLQQGASQMSDSFGMSDSLPNVMVGIILFFIIGCEFFINYQVAIGSGKRSKKGEAK